MTRHDFSYVLCIYSFISEPYMFISFYTVKTHKFHIDNLINSYNLRLLIFEIQLFNKNNGRQL